MLCGVGNDWKRLGHYIGAAQGDRNIEEFAEAIGVSGRTLGDLIRGVRTSYHARILRKVETALGWSPGDAERILAGGEPRHADAGSWLDLSDPRLNDTDRQMILAWLRERGINPAEQGGDTGLASDLRNQNINR